jgi:hypothetical protein
MVFTRMFSKSMKFWIRLHSISLVWPVMPVTVAVTNLKHRLWNFQTMAWHETAPNCCWIREDIFYSLVRHRTDPYKFEIGATNTWARNGDSWVEPLSARNFWSTEYHYDTVNFSALGFVIFELDRHSWSPAHGSASKWVCWVFQLYFSLISSFIQQHSATVQ